jgi:hypothetical protein
MIRIAITPAAYAAWDRPSAAPFWDGLAWDLLPKQPGRAVGIEPAYI